MLCHRQLAGLAIAMMAVCLLSMPAFADVQVTRRGGVNAAETRLTTTTTIAGYTSSSGSGRSGSSSRGSGGGSGEGPSLVWLADRGTRAGACAPTLVPIACVPINLGGGGGGGAAAAAPAAVVVVVPPIVLARELRNQLVLPNPRVGTSPDGRHQNPGLVQMPVWWWVSNGATLTQRSELGPSWAEVTATPVSSTWRASDGYRQSCGSLGAEGSGVCAFTYTRSNAEEVATVSVSWRVTWVGSDGTGGTLAPLAASVQVPYPVYERQAIVIG